MPRSLVQDVKDSLNKQETGDVYVTLVRVKENDSTPIALFSSDSVDTVFNTLTFSAYPFDITLPDSQEGQETRARLTLTNVDRVMIEKLRNATEHLLVDLWVVFMKAPNYTSRDVMAYYPNMELREVVYDTMTVSGSLTYESFLSEPFPKDLMTARHFPGLFIQ
jgi:hypothetical protein